MFLCPIFNSRTIDAKDRKRPTLLCNVGMLFMELIYDTSIITRYSSVNW